MANNQTQTQTQTQTQSRRQKEDRRIAQFYGQVGIEPVANFTVWCGYFCRP